MSKAHHCPVCNSNNVDYGNLEFTSKFNTSIVAYGHCYDCEADFREHYNTDYQRSEVYEDNNEALDVAEAVSEDLRKRKHK